MESTIMAPVLDSFPRFAELPVELRLQIWNWAALLPRIIELSWNSNPHCVVSTTAPNPVLRTSREARYETIDGFDGLKLHGSSQIILLHYSHDTLFFGPGCKHLVPSGNTERWTQINRKLIRDIMSSSCLKQNLKAAAFDTGFLMALDDQGRGASFEVLVGRMRRLEEVVIVRTQDWEDAKEECESNVDALKFIEAKVLFQEERLAIDRSRHSNSNIQKIWTADIEVLKRCVENPPRSSGSLKQAFSNCGRATYLRCRKILASRFHHCSETCSQHPPTYSASTS